MRAARAGFAERGYAAVTLDEVARAAHATTGAVYHHFGGKAGLLLAVGEQVEREIAAAIGARIPAGASPWEAIAAATEATLDLCTRPEVARIIFEECPNTLGAAAWREVEMRYGLGGLHAMFRRAADAGELQPPDPELVTRVFMAGLTEAVAAIVEDGSTERARGSRAVAARLLEAFRARPPAPRSDRDGRA